MLKSILFTLIINLFFFSVAHCQSIDTSTFYYKYSNIYTQTFFKVKELDSCDFYRMILPPDSGETLYNVKEFYKDGVPKLIGKSVADVVEKDHSGAIKLQGSCLSFYNTGKRKSIINYENGIKNGLDYEYFPNGNLYCIYKFDYLYPYSSVAFYLECHDIDGSLICKDGNGYWKNYDFDFKNTTFEGNIKNTRRDGEWRGITTLFSDSIKYVYIFKKGTYVSSSGYDKTGAAHPFVMGHEQTLPVYRKNIIDFVRVFRSHLSVPRDTGGKKINIDTVKITFTVQENGKLVDFETVGKIDPNLAGALATAFDKSPTVWQPRTFFGIPLRSKLTIPIKETSGFEGDSNIYSRSIYYWEKIIIP